MDGEVVGAPCFGDTLHQIGVEIDTDTDERGIDTLVRRFVHHAEESLFTQFSLIGHGICHEDHTVFVLIPVRCVFIETFEEFQPRFVAGAPVGTAFGPEVENMFFDCIHIGQCNGTQGFCPVGSGVEEYHAQTVFGMEVFEHRDQ